MCKLLISYRDIDVFRICQTFKMEQFAKGQGRGGEELVELGLFDKGT